VAKTLGLSQRTLQRRLTLDGTSVQRELLEHRLRRAQRALEGDEPVTAIAFEAGFATPQHFSTAFKKFTGLSPTEWRARARPTPKA
jgi:AraC-like DNA-binding protein